VTEQALTWLVVQHEKTRRTVNVFVLGTTPAAVLWSHRARRWMADPATVAEVSWTNRVEGQDRLRETDRAGAEEAARQFGQTLPTDQELRRLLSAPPT
jgi:hypothetical protein